MAYPSKRDSAAYIADLGRELAALAKKARLDDSARLFAAGADAAQSTATSSDESAATSPPGN